VKITKIIVTSIIIVGIIASISFFIFDQNFIQNPINEEDKGVELIEWSSGKLFNILVNPDDLILVEGKTIPLKATFGLKEELNQTYEKIGFFGEEKKSLFIIPTFTASAYSKNGFYDFYNENCSEQCLTTKIVTENKLDYSSSANSVKILQLLEYDSISDLELHQNPSILKNYDKVIVLHNEYVSKIMFDAITAHKNIVFLYPNSLYGEIELNDSNNKITLVRGHGYPSSDIKNGFNWENENTDPYEFDNECNNWKFYPISNGHMLNCYPEQIIWKNESLLQFLKDL
jgi:hypothetical protein